MDVGFHCLGGSLPLRGRIRTSVPSSNTEWLWFVKTFILRKPPFMLLAAVHQRYANTRVIGQPLPRSTKNVFRLAESDFLKAGMHVFDCRQVSTFSNALLWAVCTEPGIEGVQALTEISHSALCCHSNKTRAPIANPSNSAQLVGSPTILPSYIQVCAVLGSGNKAGTDRHRRPWPIGLYISPWLRLTQM